MKILYVLCLFIGICLNFYGQNSLKAYIDIKKFYSTENGSYLEIFNKINGESIKYSKSNNEIQGKVVVRYSIYTKDSLLFNSNDTLVTPQIKDSLINDLYDIKLIPIKSGIYQIEIEYEDLNSIDKRELVKTKTSFEVKDIDTTQMVISNIQIADYIYKTKENNTLSKYGYDILPHLGNYFSTECNILPIYFETYNFPKDSNKYLLTYTLLDLENNNTIENIIDTISLNKEIIKSIIKPLDIRTLLTGHYTLKIKIENKQNRVLANSNYEFYRTNSLEYKTITQQTILDPSFQKSIDSDSLQFFAKSLFPIIFSEDQKILLRLLNEKDTSKLRIFIQSFWKITSKGKNPYEAWLVYKKQVLATEKLYKTHNIHGFETERGRVYLKYGPPTAISTRESSPSEYPYEIWQYDKIKTFANKRFVFYNPDIVGNNFRLLHSDMNGEIKNFKWPGLLRKRNNSTINVDDPLEGGFEHYGGESTEVYNQY